MFDSLRSRSKVDMKWFSVDTAKVIASWRILQSDGEF